VKQQLVVIRLDRATLVWLSGAIDGSLAPALHDALRRLIDDRSSPLVLDLLAVPAIDDGVVSVLAAASSRAGRCGGIDLRLPRGRRELVRDESSLRRAINAAYPAAA
jgi:anti-anti-sigma regulatory factor